MQPDKHSERARLLQLRQQIPSAKAQRWTESIAQNLLQALQKNSVQCVSVYMPFRAEPDLTRHYQDYAEKWSLALPVCDENGLLMFVQWHPDDPMQPGRYGISVPCSQKRVEPDAIVMPCVGFNRAAFRLGYGGGWFDRTLEQLPPKVALLGVAYQCLHTDAFTPELHDRPMTCVVTEQGIQYPA